MGFLDELRQLDSPTSRKERDQKINALIVKCVEKEFERMKFDLRQQVIKGHINSDASIGKSYGKRYVIATNRLYGRSIPYELQSGVYHDTDNENEIFANNAKRIIECFVSMCSAEGIIGSGRAGDNYREPIILSAIAYID